MHATGAIFKINFFFYNKPGLHQQHTKWQTKLTESYDFRGLDDMVLKHVFADVCVDSSTHQGCMRNINIKAHCIALNSVLCMCATHYTKSKFPKIFKSSY